MCEKYGDDASLDLLYVLQGKISSYKIGSGPVHVTRTWHTYIIFICTSLSRHGCVQLLTAQRGLHLVGMSQYFGTLSDLIADCRIDESCLGIKLHDFNSTAPPRPTAGKVRLGTPTHVSIPLLLSSKSP